MSERLKEISDDLERENKRYREALEFYLSKNNWDEGLVYLDGGYKARKALEVEE